ncbi:MAG: SIMPL domain-containing protein, partial [Dehalococcoidia bacterium]
MFRQWLSSKRRKGLALALVLSASMLVLAACAPKAGDEGAETPVPTDIVTTEVSEPPIKGAPEPVVEAVPVPLVELERAIFTSPEFAPAFQGFSFSQTAGVQQTGVVVSGLGRVVAVPDLAVLNLGVDAQADTVQVARDQAAQAMEAVLNALTGNGVAERDIKTQFFSIFPMYDYRNGSQILTGYRVTNTVTAKIRNVDNAGAVIDAAARAGGDLTRIQGISFMVDDPSPYISRAREAAVMDAVAKAEQLANLTGVTLGKPIFITESGGFAPPPIFVDRAFVEAAAAAPTPILPGETEVSVGVQIAFAIQSLEPQDAQQTGIVVSGIGSVAAVPDVAVLTLGVDAQADTAEVAREQAAQAMDAVLNALTGNGVAEGDIKTQFFSIFPMYDYRNGSQILTGYRVTNTVTAKIRNVDNAGVVIDAVVGAGGDLTRSQGSN